MRLLKYTFIIFFLFSFQVKSNENSKVRYIDIDFIFKNSIVGKKINEIDIEDIDKKIKANKKIEKKLEDQKKKFLLNKIFLVKRNLNKKFYLIKKKYKNIKPKKIKILKK